ncbi:hypothetical protein L0337_02250 [candidate division KSB1 bacterium]|nr:hypothetical protein [candidate division KSB1 bacterium]
MESFAIYTGLAFSLIGVVLIIKPMQVLKIKSRRTGAAILLFGLFLGIVAALWPVEIHYAEASQMRLDEFMPTFHFNEVHAISIQAPPEQIFEAIKAVTPNEIRFLHLFFWIRSLPTRLRGGCSSPMLTATGPLLDEMVRSGFLLLAEETNRETVLGTIMQFTDKTLPELNDSLEFLMFDQASYVKATINFCVQEKSDGWCNVKTETRVFATDPTTLKKVAAYWRMVYPGSALLRKTFLSAVKKRVEHKSQARG